MDKDNDPLESAIETFGNFVLGKTNDTAAKNSGDDVSTTEDPFFQDTFFHPSLIKDDAPCKAILHSHIGDSNLRVWDILILTPNIVFIMFLFFRLSSIRMKLRTTNSHVLRMIHSLVVSLSLTSAFRCFTAILLYLVNPVHDVTDTLIWQTAHLIFLASELIIGILVMTGGKVENDTVSHCKRVMVLAAIIAVVISSVQLYLELHQPYYGYLVLATNYHMFGFGGPVFLAIISFMMILFYFAMFVVGISSARLDTFSPSGYRYFLYSLARLMSYAMATIGGAMLSVKINSGMCLINLATYCYFVTFAPLVYFCFLQPHFSTSQSSFQFSYRSHLDEEDEYHEDDLYGNISSNSNIIIDSNMSDQKF